MRLSEHSLQSLLAVRPLDRIYAGTSLAGAQSVLVRQLLPGLPEAECADTARVFQAHMSRLATLESAGTLPVREYVTSESGPFYFVTDVPRGTKAGELVRQAGSLPVPVVAAIGVAVGELLMHAHERDVLHLSLHRGQVLVSPEGGVTLLDLGLVPLLLERVQGRLRAVHTAWNFLFPDPGCVAPELLASEPCTPVTDVYGLGTLLHLLSTAMPPFVGSSIVAYNAILSGRDPVDPRAHLAELDPGFSELVTRCLDRDPAGRPQTVKEVVEALRPHAATLEAALAQYRPVLGNQSYVERFEPLLRVVDGGADSGQPEPSPAVVPLFVDRPRALGEAELLASMTPDQRGIYLAGVRAPTDHERRKQVRRGVTIGLIAAVILLLFAIPQLTKQSPAPTEKRKPDPALLKPPRAPIGPIPGRRGPAVETPSNRYKRGLARTTR